VIKLAQGAFYLLVEVVEAMIYTTVFFLIAAFAVLLLILIYSLIRLRLADWWDRRRFRDDPVPAHESTERDLNVDPDQLDGP